MSEQNTMNIGSMYEHAQRIQAQRQSDSWGKVTDKAFDAPQENERPETPLVREITTADFERNAELVDMSGYRPYRQSLLTLIATQLVPSARASDVIIAQPKSYRGLRVGIGGRYFELHCEDVTPALANHSLDNDLLTWFDSFITRQVKENPSDKVL